MSECSNADLQIALNRSQVVPYAACSFSHGVVCLGGPEPRHLVLLDIEQAARDDIYNLLRCAHCSRHRVWSKRGNLRRLVRNEITSVLYNAMRWNVKNVDIAYHTRQKANEGGQNVPHSLIIGREDKGERECSEV